VHKRSNTTTFEYCLFQQQMTGLTVQKNFLQLRCPNIEWKDAGLKGTGCTAFYVKVSRVLYGG
jgi:hypothetical protein